MYPINLLSPSEWAERQFGRTELGDRRRTRRLVETAVRMMRDPRASLPRQMRQPKALEGAYHLLGDEVLGFAAISKAHWQQSLAAARLESVVLLVQDTTQIDHTKHPSIKDLGPIGNGEGAGYLLQTVLAVVPKPRQVLGIAHQEPFIRVPAPEDESRDERRTRPRESAVWPRAVAAIGEAPEGTLWVHVGDASSDFFDYLAAARELHCHFLVRAAQNRRVEPLASGAKPEAKTQPAGASLSHLLDYARSLPTRPEPSAERWIHLSASHGKPAREALVRLSFGRLAIQAPSRGEKRDAQEAWVIHVWEPSPSPEVEEPLDWVLITSVETNSVEAAWERTEWYACRWLVEDYHMCLKTGCSVEERRLGSAADLFRLLGLLAPIAVRLLQLREIARLDPERLAREVLPAELVAVVASLAELPPETVETMSVNSFWREVAKQGGYLGRRRDGPPGWQSLWAGWLYVQTIIEGIHLAARLPPHTCA